MVADKFEKEWLGITTDANFHVQLDKEIRERWQAALANPGYRQLHIGFDYKVGWGFQIPILWTFPGVSCLASIKDDFWVCPNGPLK